MIADELVLWGVGGFLFLLYLVVLAVTVAAWLLTEGGG